jgi:SAM-dependent methyltransferase
MSAALSMPAAESGMIGHAQFSSATDTHTYRLQDETILLRHDPEVFPPSSFGLNFAERIDFSGCRRTADIGTGTGLLAILAARKGVADVKATDISAAALHLADGNARELNGVDAVDLRLGHFFCDLEGTFDLITANLPHFLDVAARHMHWATRLYVIVNTITDYRATLRKIEAGFSPALVWQGKTATKSFVRDNIPFFRELMDAGIVSLIEDGRGQWQARQFIYRLGLKR